MTTTAGKFTGVVLVVLAIASFVPTVRTVFAADGIPAGARPAVEADLSAMRAAGIPNPKVGMLWDPKNPYVGIEAGDAKTYLMKKNDAGQQDIAGLNAEFACRLARFLKASESAGYNFRISSGFRSSAQQAALYRAKPNLAAPPGGSNHERGLAADLTFNGRSGGCPSFAPCLWAHQNAAQSGLRFPMAGPNGVPIAPGKKYEPWHIEPGGSVGGASTCGDLSSGPAIDPGVSAPLGVGDSLRNAVSTPPTGAAQPTPAPTPAPTTPPPSNICTPQFTCSNGTMYYRTSSCTTQPYEVCERGCAGNICATATSSVRSTSTPIFDLFGSPSSPIPRSDATKQATSTIDLINALADPTSTNAPTSTPFVLTLDGRDIVMLQVRPVSQAGENISPDTAYFPPQPQQTFTSSDLSGSPTLSPYPPPQISTFQSVLADLKIIVLRALDLLKPFRGKTPAQEYADELPGE